ncbi:MAG: maleylpyruvate isomerase family mycothiol-dependent enzyme [Acidimicrobiales bacterium]
MDISTHIDALEQQGQLLGDAAQRNSLDAALPPCPDWQLRDLLNHIVDVNRWAASYVSSGRSEPMSEAEENEFFSADRPADANLVDWFREGHRSLIGALRAAPDDLACWKFLPAPSPLAFWARRQAHETTVHRYDAESATGDFSPIDPLLAADGVDELFRGFAARGNKLLRDPERCMSVTATDTGDRWHVTLGPETVSISGAEVPTVAECRVSGRAEDLYFGLWNRVPTTRLHVDGDPDVLAGFCDSLRVRWS